MEMTIFPRASQPFSAIAVLGLVGLCALGCAGTETNPGGASGGPGGLGQAGSSATGGAGTGVGGGNGMPVDLSKGGPKLRVLTRTEYTNAITDLFGTITTKLSLPEDTHKAGFVSVGGAEVAINSSSVELYETAARAVAAEVFGDAARWQKLVGCQPKNDLSDECVLTFIKTVGKRAFRRDLADAEVQQWLKVGKDTSTLSTAAQGLAGIVSGFLQSPNFLYRVETNKLDASNGRLKYDGASMATRLAFLLTGYPPSETLLAQAAAGQLDTADGVKTAAAPLLNDPKALERMAEFFDEYSQADFIMAVQKSAVMYPDFSDTLRGSMLQATKLFIRNIVLAPGADVRGFFDSDQTFVDAILAPTYGVTPPASGFAQVKLAPESGRAGILGQAAVVAGHAQPDHTSPTRRGVFITGTFLCQEAPPPPPGVLTELPNDPTLTWRQKLELHRTLPACAACHALFDPPGMAMEHLDSVGKYRTMENGQPIDATGTLDGVAFNGVPQLGAAMRGNANALSCMVSNFYRNANGVVTATADTAQLTALSQALSAKNFVWRDFVSEFVASDAFRSAPAAAITAGNQ